MVTGRVKFGPTQNATDTNAVFTLTTNFYLALALAC